jgi:cytochrome c
MRPSVLDRRMRLVAPCLLVGLGATVVAAAEKDLTAKGEVLVKENCARCHAIGKEGASPHPEAPPFRTLSSKYPVEDLAESLAEGIVSGHPDMPIFAFTAHDVAAIIDYLQSIQDAPAQPAEEPDPL